MIHKLSCLGKTWIFDIDGTIVKHNGYKEDGYDTLLKGAAEFMNSLPKEDVIILMTSRKENVKKPTIEFLKKNRIRFDEIIFNLPYGERILINDRKLSRLNTAIAINTNRDKFMEDKFEIDYEL